MRRRAAGTACGLLLDRALGEPPARVHPVAWFGSVMGVVERQIYATNRAAGVQYTTLGVAIGCAAGLVLPTSVMVATAVAGRELRRVADDILGALRSDDLDRARELVPSLVGRDPSSLDASGLAAAVIESLAENSVDAVVAPAWWALLGGGTGAAAYRAVNTMDSMVGHRSERYEQFGWASARLDDGANFVPARLTAALLAFVRPGRAVAIRRAIREHAVEHPSPNAGVAEAAFAATLGIELGGPLRYGARFEDRPRLGWGPRPQPEDIARAITLASHLELALVGALFAVSICRRRHK